ncbi:pyruvate phosphate dikinase PEP/pyruvate-binding [Rippkaea orientalis PCC 8801]|uniref:Pyruvate phosphate dikinase PEP/pyruvate-binding n=1 Tax=Rippkaea orientalis (strain PCC 8801 / RF-1) TaxID=41431 RepID=B7JWP9_RIPO1|nr:glycerol-3-phosphate acyltransferase [Rippkaea orientalis]ACK64695.1 pyruvate phosphate dikinase PEP/pyruvate-binding [Rippkaea orientalis PCC 8801]
MTSVWGSLLIFLFCPILGGLPLINWINYFFTGRKLSQLGTGNISVSAAFYHGGTLVGILAALSEASKGIIAVLLARAFFPLDPIWELIALISLIMGRYWIAKGAGTTNLFWGMIAHDWQATLLTALIAGGSFTIFRDRATGRLIALFLLAFILTVRHPYDPGYMVMSWSLSGLVAWIFAKIPDDLDLPEPGTKPYSKKMFRFFRGDNAILSLNRQLNSEKVGSKAATLAYLKRLGYQVPEGWILVPGDDPQPLLDYLEPSIDYPFVVRSSALEEDTATSSAAGQYLTILNVTSTEELKAAILDCLNSYNHPNAVRYRRDRVQHDEGMAVLIQPQIKGVFSGVAFSRDPVNPINDIVVVEALPGQATRVVSGKITPEQYRVEIYHDQEADAVRIQTLNSDLELCRDVPDHIVEKVAILARDIEDLYHGIPQDIEWSYDGQQLWLLQARSITTLQPIWTRKIAAEVIPGVIRPLTWSINRPLTCGVWGEIFTLVLGKRAQGLDFNETARLHYQRAYFNATLLGEIFLRMGLPSESLEFLIRRTKFSKPPLISTLYNSLGLIRLLKKELSLEKDFNRDNKNLFEPQLKQINEQSLSALSPPELLTRIESILLTLKRATYYSILAPLSFALRQSIFNVSLEQLDNSSLPEVASLEALTNLANRIRSLVNISEINHSDSLFNYLENNPQGQTIIREFNQILEQYGYLSDVATDISIPCWKDHPQSIEQLLTQLVLNQKNSPPKITKYSEKKGKLGKVQQRLNIKGKVTSVYSQLLAQLRWTFLALSEIWYQQEILLEKEDIFYLTYQEIREVITEQKTEFKEQIKQRKEKFKENQQLETIPYIVYGNIPPNLTLFEASSLTSTRQLRGIGASVGQATGKVKIIRNLQSFPSIEPNTILVVPYTDSGWAPLLSSASGIISEVGGTLSHGAIVAREYGIPAVMDIPQVTQRLKDGQWVRIDGQQGIVEIIENNTINKL